MRTEQLALHRPLISDCSVGLDATAVGDREVARLPYRVLLRDAARSHRSNDNLDSSLYSRRLDNFAGDANAFVVQHSKHPSAFARPPEPFPGTLSFQGSS